MVLIRLLQASDVSSHCDLLSHLDPHKSMELDGIHPRVMSELAEELAKPLSIIYQQSWLSGEVPDDWKLANVTPIHKKGCKEDPENSRPVSLTSVPGKVLRIHLLKPKILPMEINGKALINFDGGPKGHSDCIISLYFPLHNKQHVVLFSIYAPTLQADPAEKDKSYTDLRCLTQKVPTDDKIVILGDFNTRIGKNFETWKGVLGKHDVGMIMITFC
ncbi:hypothetical protein BTVI_03852 [Pitangus sulphuratus]|nr:hypothetical protein BTVI_03852 [Pitangus sulphuratus]